MSGFDDSEAFEHASLSSRAMAARPRCYLDGLNPAQREAVETLEGPVLMLAGAGTGKTRALTARIAHMLATGAARPNEILAVTFTNKAAREVRTRVGEMIGQTVEWMPWLGTFHAICAKLLRRHAELAGLKSNFTILDKDDQLRLLKQLIQAANIDEGRWPARLLANIIDNWKNRAWRHDKMPAADASAYDQRGVDLYGQYQLRLKELNACDFGDLLLHMVHIFQTHDDVLRQYQHWFRYILVDEYQDTNVAQYLWLRLLAQIHSNICCVGDDDQSIYGWRGAEVGNILRFESDFPGTNIVRLEQNYRSTGHILATASGLIAANKNRLGKTLWTEGEDGEKVRLIGHWDGEEEARWIGEEIEAMHRGTRGMAPISPEGMAILVRTAHQMRTFEDRFLTIGLPYRVIGGPRFYERMEIRDAMAYFRVVVSPDDNLAFERIVNIPKRGLGDRAMQIMQTMARTRGVNLLEGARLCLDTGKLTGRGARELAILLQGIARWRSMLAGALPADDDDLVVKMGTDNPPSHIELAEVILDESGYTAMWQNNKTPEAPGRLENLKELIKALEGFENLQGFLEHVSLIMENEAEDGEEKVTLMTLHAAKGLGFPAIFLPGWEDGLFPNQRALDEGGMNALEEERRLAYVGVTRAEVLCTISFAGNRRVYGKWQSQLPSRFIDELPADHVEVLTPPGLYGHGRGTSPSAFANADTMQGGDLHQKASQSDVYNSPGWKRLQANQGRRSISQPRDDGPMIIDAKAHSTFMPGDRVFHQKFGYGSVESVDGDKVKIDFDKAGVKHVMGRFLVAADRAGM
ncbi:MAG: UvrD-helicase domain-containing protein [Rhodobacteraceae bacterium]|nr:UvrD-helicase domain-containing protein [Paracoccaceae bacterium]